MTCSVCSAGTDLIRRTESLYVLSFCLSLSFWILSLLSWSVYYICPSFVVFVSLLPLIISFLIAFTNKAQNHFLQKILEEQTSFNDIFDDELIRNLFSSSLTSRAVHHQWKTEADEERLSFFSGLCADQLRWGSSDWTPQVGEHFDLVSEQIRYFCCQQLLLMCN